MKSKFAQLTSLLSMLWMVFIVFIIIGVAINWNLFIVFLGFLCITVIGLACVYLPAILKNQHGRMDEMVGKKLNKLKDKVHDATK